MTRRLRLPDRFLHLALTTLELAVIALASNLRLTVVAGIAAGAVWCTRIRLSGLAAVVLLAAAGCVSIVSPGP